MRNTLRCQLTGKERITNLAYLGRRLEALKLDKDDPKSLEYFRHHYASEKEVAKVRRVILESGLEEAKRQWGGPWKYEGNVQHHNAWLLRVAIMNGKNKLFKSALEAKYPGGIACELVG